MTGCWPYAGDSPTVRARRIALAYRMRLELSDPDACLELDLLCRRWGEGWAVPRRVTYEPDDWITATEAAELANVGVATVRQWRARGRLHGELVGRTWWYLARDIYELSGQPRHRKASVTDTLPNSGRSLPA